MLGAHGTRRRIEVTWQEGPGRRVAISEFVYQADYRDDEKIRWYLEDYAEFPFDPAPALAREAEARLKQIGADLFQQVFSSRDASAIWERARGQLAQVRIEVDSDSVGAPALPWELLRDPVANLALARDARAFVRNDAGTDGHPGLPEAAGDRLRVLLVICRPGGGDDVPFRSVARRLVRGAAEPREGLDLDVLRPATFHRLAEVLHAAAAAGRPYHVVHFDGHGAYLDLANLGYGEEADGGMPVRTGQHGYLVFEAPGKAMNEHYVGGPALGGLLADTGVPVLVLNACRSAYSEVPELPGDLAAGQGGTASGQSPKTSSPEKAAALTADAHDRIRAYGSLAAEVADAGLPGVVAMRYNVYVVTAAQFVADLYAHLLAGSTLGEAATAARRAMAEEPARQVGAEPVRLQDWTVPVVYEAAPLALVQPLTREVPRPLRTLPDSTEGSSMPRPSDAGLVGRDETLLALDRAFDTRPIVLLHGCAGAGKSSAAAEFAHWYQVTGGLDTPGHPDAAAGPVLWSSFEHHLPLDGLLDRAGRRLAGLLEKEGIRWQAITDPAERRDLLLGVLTRVPALWVWDNIEPVTGFPIGSRSDWTAAEQTAITAFLRDLARTRCKVLLVSRRDELSWLGELPARVQLPPMPMHESLQLVEALAARHDHPADGTDWQPLLRYAAGNPLTITVLTGRVLREHLTTTQAVAAFTDQLRAGDTDLEAAQDAALGRTRSLAASLSYGFDRGFSDAERHQLALLHLFRDTIDAGALGVMGVADDDAVPELAGLTTREAGIALLDRAADIGMLTPYGGGYYRIHPALPWYLTALFTDAYGQPGAASAGRATRAYTRTIATFSHIYHQDAQGGYAEDAVNALRIEEGNLRHALDLARSGEHWEDALACVQGLHILYLRTGRVSEWTRIVDEISPDYTDPETGGPLPGREKNWGTVVSYQAELAIEARDWPAATTLQRVSAAWYRDRAAGALAAPAAELTPAQRNEIHNLGGCLHALGLILSEQGDPGCLAAYQEALGISRRIGARIEEAETAIDLGNAYIQVPGLRDLDQAEEWYRLSLDLRSPGDRLGRAKSQGQLAHLAHERFKDAQAARAAWDVLEKHLHAALHRFQKVLELIEADDDEYLALTYSGIGAIYTHLGDYRQALDHYQQALRHEEERRDTYGSGHARFNIAGLLAADDRPDDALHYARAALADYENTGPGAAQEAARTQQILTRLELTNLGNSLAGERRFDEAAAVHKKAVAIYRETGDSRGERTALNSLGRALTEARRFGDAISAHQTAAAICRDFRDRHGEGIALANLGKALTGARRSDEAITAGQEAVAIFQQTGHRHGEATALNSLGLALTQLRRFDDAIAAHQTAAAIYRDIQDLGGEGEALTNLGIALVESRRFDAAITASQDAATIFRETQDRHSEGMALVNLGNALREMKHFDAAITAHEKAAAIFRETQDRHSEGMALVNLGNALQQNKRLEDAITACQDAGAIFRDTEDQHGEGVALSSLAPALLLAQRFDEAITACQDAAVIFRDTGDHHREAKTLLSLALALQQVQRFDEAITTGHDAVAKFRDTEDQYGEGLALTSLGQVLAGVHRFGDAVTAYESAAAIFQESGDRHREAQTLIMLGSALVQLWRWRDAITACEKGAAILQQTGDQDEARRALVLLGIARAARAAQRLQARWGGHRT